MLSVSMVLMSIAPQHKFLIRFIKDFWTLLASALDEVSEEGPTI